MEPIDFTQVLFRASANGEIMTDPQSKVDREAGRLGETAKKYCRQLYREITWRRRKDVTTKYMEKGLMVEEDGITLYSRVKKKFLKKNEEHLSNQWVKGHPDLFQGGETILQAEEIDDIKASWDVFTFPFHTDPINKIYYWQLQTYMDLAGPQCRQGKLIYTLIDTPDILIGDEKRRLMYRMGVATDLNPLYMEACELLDRNMRFDDIPMEERVLEFVILRNDADIERLHNRVEQCRRYMAEELHKGHRPEVNKVILQKIEE